MHVHHTISLTARSETDSDLDPLRDALPDATDTRLHGVSTDADGDVTGTPTKRSVTDTTDPETDDSVVRVMLAVTDGDVAQTLWDELTNAVADVDAEGRCHRQPVGSQTASEVHAWYREHPGEQPTDDDGESFIPSAWVSEYHTVAEY